MLFLVYPTSWGLNSMTIIINSIDATMAAMAFLTGFTELTKLEQNLTKNKSVWCSKCIFSR